MLRAAAVFSDHMVLQRDKKICVFGEGDSGKRIAVTVYKDEMKAEGSGMCREGKWMVYLPELSAATGFVMEITDGEDIITFEDIAVGEVWLAGGQSNMELELQNADGGQELLALGTKGNNCKNECEEKELSPEQADLKERLNHIRFYYTPKQAYKGEIFDEIERASHWELFNQADAAKWSAVGVYFGLELLKKLDVTVGIIGCNWGGTSASCWMSREAIVRYDTTKSYIEEYESSDYVKKPEAEQIKEYEEYEIRHKKWDEKAAEIYAVEPMMPFDKIQEILGPCEYPGPMNCVNFIRPAGLYETMLKRVMPYTLRGFIYYQGESDEHKPDSYYDLFTGMIRQWREDWGDDFLPFLMVQLPMHRYQHDPDTKSWCTIRESQMKAYHTLRNTGIAVIIDCGQFHEIHPKNKKPVGERLAWQAFSSVYGLMKKEEAFGPVYKDFLYKDGGMEITFDYADEGMIFIGEAPEAFELAGSDGVFEKADAVLMENKVLLKSEKIEVPVMARYLWTNYSEVNVFGKNNLPMAPFRTHFFD